MDWNLDPVTRVFVVVSKEVQIKALAMNIQTAELWWLHRPNSHPSPHLLFYYIAHNFLKMCKSYIGWKRWTTERSVVQKVWMVRYSCSRDRFAKSECRYSDHSSRLLLKWKTGSRPVWVPHILPPLPHSVTVVTTQSMVAGFFFFFIFFPSCVCCSVFCVGDQFTEILIPTDWQSVCVFGCNLPPTTLLAVTGIFYVLDYFCNTGWNEYRNKSQHRKLTHEKKILPPLLQGLEPATVRLLVRFLPPPVHVLFSFLVCVTPPRFTRRRCLGRLSVVRPVSVTKNMLSALFLSSTARPVFHIRF